MATLPGMTSSYSDIYGGKPLVPNPTTTASSAISGDIGNLGKLYQLGTGVSNYGENQLTANYNAAIPNYSALATQSSANIGSELKGELPDDVVRQIINQAAERGIATGTSNSPNAGASLLSHFLGTSLDMTNLGERNLSGAVARSPIAQPFDISRMLVNPEQAQEAQMMSNIYASAPNPAAAARRLEMLAAGDQGNNPWFHEDAAQLFPHGDTGFNVGSNLYA